MHKPFLQSPQTLASLSGWAGAAFLVGIAGHSVWPYQTVDLSALSIAIVIAIALLSLGWKQPWIKAIAVCLLAIALGVWRFDSAHNYLPRGLVPFSPKGLAYASETVTTADPMDPRYWLGRTRRFLTDRAHQIFPPDEAALLTGVLYGERGLSKEVKDEFRNAGLLHIIAVSGSNVTIVVVLVMPFLLALGLTRRRAFIALTIVLFAFVLFVNPSASVVRAAIMGWLVELAPLVGRIPRPSRLLLISAVAFSAWQPWALLYDASFALSFLAMWGLLTWSKLLNERLRSHLTWENVREILCATVGATVMTVPYTAWSFGQVSLFGLITSLLALPLLPWVMTTGVAALLLPSAPFLLWPAKGFLELLLWIARLPTFVPFGVWSKLSTPFSVMLACYVMLCAIWLYLERQKRVIPFSQGTSPTKLSDRDDLSETTDKD